MTFFLLSSAILLALFAVGIKPTSVFSNVCPGTLDDGMCLYLHSRPLSWSDGNLVCSLMGATQISVMDQRRQDLLNSNLLNGINETVWLGGKLKLVTDWSKSQNGEKLQSQGCYVANTGVMMQSPDMELLTVDMCLDHCNGTGYAYAAVQYGYKCMCTQDFSARPQTLITGCNSRCEGDQSSTCGGYSRNQVYYIGGEFGTWSKNQPNNFQSKQFCAIVTSTHQYKLADEKCTDEFSYICDIDCNVKAPSFSGGYVSRSSRDRCYVIGTRQVTWFKANENCLRIGAVLAQIHNSTHFIDIKEVLMEVSTLMTKYIWVGVSRVDFKWSNNVMPKYTNWMDSYPGALEEEQCISVNKQEDSLWKVSNCNDENFVICEYKMNSDTTTTVSTTTSTTTTTRPVFKSSTTQEKTTKPLPTTTTSKSTPHSTTTPTTTSTPTTTTTPTTTREVISTSSTTTPPTYKSTSSTTTTATTTSSSPIPITTKTTPTIYKTQSTRVHTTTTRKTLDISPSKANSHIPRDPSFATPPIENTRPPDNLTSRADKIITEIGDTTFAPSVANDAMTTGYHDNITSMAAPAPLPASGSSTSGGAGDVGSTMFYLMVAICGLLLLTIICLTAMCIYIVRTKNLRQVGPEVVDMRDNSSYEWEVTRRISYNACKPLITKEWIYAISDTEQDSDLLDTQTVSLPKLNLKSSLPAVKITPRNSSSSTTTRETIDNAFGIDSNRTNSTTLSNYLFESKCKDCNAEVNDIGLHNSRFHKKGSATELISKKEKCDKNKCKECGHRRSIKKKKDKKSRRRSRGQIIDASMVDAMMQL